MSPVSAEELEDFRSADRKRADHMAVKRRRQLAVRAEPGLMDIEGKRAFVDASALQELGNPVGARSPLCRKRRVQCVAERNRASIVVVLNPAEPGGRNGLVASMLGAGLCTPSFLASGKGAALKLRAALQAPRYIFVSAACQAKHATMTNLMRSVSGGEQTSRWQFFDSSVDQRASCLARAARRTGTHEEDMVTRVLPAERGEFARFAGVQTVRDCMGLLRKPDLGRSHMGYCER